MFPEGKPPESDFPMSLESEHFILYFGLRNPLHGKGLGVAGVRDRVVVLTYLDGLERLYSVMTSPPWNRKPPIVDTGGKTRVYIYNSEIAPYTAEDAFADTDPPGGRVPYIVLLSRSAEPTTEAELRRATAEAVHEATHVFNSRERPFHELASAAWEWFDEAMAVFMETVVVPGNPDYFRFILNWIDMPELSLDDRRARYQAGMFIRYLAKRIGPNFINEVWMQSKKNETPLIALERVLQKYDPGRKLISSNEPDIFASGYCMEPYFLWDHESKGHAPDIFVRYGERAVCESSVLRLPTTEESVSSTDLYESEGTLDHLACHYYRYYVTASVSGVRFQLTTTPFLDSTTPLKAEIAIATADKRRRPQIRILSNTESEFSGDTVLLSTDLTIDDPDNIDHIVLVVSNCGTRANFGGVGEHDDERSYTIQVTPYR